MSTKIKILHLEDLPEDAELIEYELHKGHINFEKRIVDNRKDYEKALNDFHPDIILSDHSLPSFDSFQALEILKERKLHIPFILITATMSEEFAVDIMKRGASDYVLKDRLQRLPSAVINSIAKRRLEDEQQASHERLLLHIENTPLGFIEWDNKGFVKSWSKRAEEIFGWTEKEFIEIQENEPGKIYTADLSWVNTILEPLISGDVERNKVQHENTTKEGSIIWCEWFNSVLKDKDGKVKTIMSLVQDITEQKQMEWQKDNFLSIVSHELKTPLTTIKAYGQIAEDMLEENGDIEILDMVKRMSSQVNKLTTLVQDLLDFTRTQKGKLLYNEEFYDFNELIKEAVADMQKINITHKINYHPGQTAPVFVDSNKLSQVINNMVSNAIKYSPKSNKINVRTERKEDGMQLSVEDFGIGISSQNQVHVFDQFYRVNKDNQSTFPGMGIGLYISAEIVRKQGGKIWVESEIDKGSTFYVWLPFDHRLKNN